MEFFSDKLFELLIKKRSDDPSLLKIIADHRDLFKKTINQLNRIYDELPDNAKAGTSLNGRLSSINESDFRGALAEAITNYVLKHFKFDTYYEPKIRTADGEVTPDFYAISKDRTFIAETFSPGKTTEQRKLENHRDKVWNLLSGLSEDYHIIIRGYPIPDGGGGFHQLEEELKAFLGTCKLPIEGVQTIRTKKGAVLNFTVHEKHDAEPGLRLGWVASRVENNNFHLNILEALRDKRKKYKFPFVASCVVLPSVWAEDVSFYRALVGDPQIVINIPRDRSSAEKPQEPFSTNSYTGFWGVNGPDFHKSYLVQAVLVMHVYWSEDGGLKIGLSLYENPHFLTDLRKVFPGVNDKVRNALDSDGNKAYILEPE